MDKMVCYGAQLSVLINGTALERIKTYEGIIQGDPLSSFLFLLVVEVLSILLNGVVNNGRLSGFQVAKNDTIVSHLQFADGTIILMNATRSEVRRLHVLLMVFEVLTGLKQNLDKSSMINIGADNVIQELAAELGCKVEKLPIT
ncbi:uncharacterized protein LOC113359058 [Papaver somniferum]|uniref:uncharacterized protein LOC113359058 n=1 Tax=Papaver somniferum TaxID=3469 RepID=UPI000E70328F|nr:uncharacterized protein LOC113359058 [Papaver somniferum]